MTATENEGRKAANDYRQLIYDELTDTSVHVLLGQLLFQMGNYPIAQKYFFCLLNLLNEDHSDYPSLLYHLAIADVYQGNYHNAEDRLKQVFQYHLLHQSNHLINAQTHILIADSYLEINQFDLVEKFYQQALDIELIHLPNNHPRIGALEYYEKADWIFQQNLPIKHRYKAYCWSCMVFVYLYQGNLEKAQKYHENALNMYRRILPVHHINIKISEQNLKCTDFNKLNDAYVKICVQV